MRLDKYLKEQRIIKRRTVANELCDAGKVYINGSVKKAFYDVNIGDEIVIKYGENEISHTVVDIPYERKRKKV